MTTSTISARRRRGSGSIRERRPGVFEVRVAVGMDAAGSHTRQRSVTVHGTAADAEAQAARLAADVAARPTRTPARLLALGELLEVWLRADHPWKPSTLVGYRCAVRALAADPLARLRVQTLTPGDVRAAWRRWNAAGASTATVAGRFRVLRAALGWAYDERLIDVHPLRTMRGPGRATPRRPLPDRAVRTLLGAADAALLEAVANDTGSVPARHHRHRCELVLLMVRLAADSGARRGELAALRIDDLRDRVLHIDRADSAGQLTSPKSGHGRTLTLGSATARLWRSLAAGWERRAGHPIGPWLFSADLDHRRRLQASTLGHWFADLRDAAGVPDASLHRLRHSVATFLVARGEILQAQARLGHADAATTLREYAYALPLTDQNVADALDSHLDIRPLEQPAGRDALPDPQGTFVGPRPPCRNSYGSGRGPAPGYEANIPAAPRRK
jgi:integrase